MNQTLRINFDSKEERTKFNNIITSSKTVEDAIERVQTQLNVKLTLATSAVNKFWSKREELIKRYSNEQSENS